MVDGEEDKTNWVYLEERFGSKTAIKFGNFLFRLCFFGVLVFVLAFLRARAVFASSPLSQMKFVISQKAWYVIGRSSGMGWGGMVYLEYLLVRDLVRWADRQMLGQIDG